MNAEKTRAWLIMAGVMIAGSCLYGNNIQVANVAAAHQDVALKQVHVAFDISWENSWRNDENWDAAWVFVKFRAPGSNNWQHAYLSTNSSDHIPGANGVIDAVPDGMGVFVYRNGGHTGDVNYGNTRVLWQYGTNGYEFAKGTELEISVHAIEMVYVPQGAFYLGSGGMNSTALPTANGLRVPAFRF